MPSWGVSPFNLHIIGPQMQKRCGGQFFISCQAEVIVFASLWLLSTAKVKKTRFMSVRWPITEGKKDSVQSHTWLEVMMEYRAEWRQYVMVRAEWQWQRKQWKTNHMDSALFYKVLKDLLSCFLSIDPTSTSTSTSTTVSPDMIRLLSICWVNRWYS